MKKIIFTLLIGLFSVVLVHGQTDQGTKYLGGSFSLGFGSSKSSIGGTSADGPKTFNFGINPGVGYFISDNLMLGLGLGFSMSSSTQKSDSYEDKYTTSMFDIGPFIRYYIMPVEKMGFFFQGDVSVGFGKNKHEQTIGGTTTSRETKLTELNVGITPGIVIFVSDMVAFESTFGGLAFTSGSENYTENTVEYKDSYSDFGLSINPLFTVGVAVHLP